MPRPAIEAVRLIPALAPGLTALEVARIVVVDDGGMDVGRVGELVEDVDVDMDVDADVDADVAVGVDVGVGVDAKGVEDGVMLLMMDEVAEDDVVELDSACMVKDSGEGA